MLVLAQRISVLEIVSLDASRCPTRSWLHIALRTIEARMGYFFVGGEGGIVEYKGRYEGERSIGTEAVQAVRFVCREHRLSRESNGGYRPSAVIEFSRKRTFVAAVEVARGRFPPCSQNDCIDYAPVLNCNQ